MNIWPKSLLIIMQIYGIITLFSTADEQPCRFHADFMRLCFKRGNEAVYLKILLSKAFQSILFCFSLSSVCVDFDKSVEPSSLHSNPETCNFALENDQNAFKVL